MAEYIKLVDKNLQTRDGYQWTVGKRHRATGWRGQGLCSDEYLHCCESLEQAAMLAPMRYVKHYTRALVVSGRACESDGAKVGLRQCTVLREVTPIDLTTTQRVAVAILVSYPLFDDLGWREWAIRWMSGEDRSAAYAAASAAYATSAYAASASASAYAAYGASAHDAAAYAASAAYAAYAAYAAACAASADTDVTAAVRRVLDTPEAEWASLLEEEVTP